MEKTEAVNRLKKAGYQVQFDSSVVTVVLPAKTNVSQEIKKLKSFFEEIGYDSSFGIKYSKKKSSGEQSESRESEVLMRENDADGFEMQEDGGTGENGIVAEEAELLEIGEQFSLEDFGIS